MGSAPIWHKYPGLILQGSLRLCNWLSLRRLVSWIYHLPPACWSTFWKSNFKQQLGCRFDIMDSTCISSIFCVLTYAIIYVLIHHIIFRLYLYFLNIRYFFRYSCTNIFHWRNLYTFYQNVSATAKEKHACCIGSWDSNFLRVSYRLRISGKLVNQSTWSNLNAELTETTRNLIYVMFIIPLESY